MKISKNSLWVRIAGLLVISLLVTALLISSLLLHTADTLYMGALESAAEETLIAARNEFLALNTQMTDGLNAIAHSRSVRDYLLETDMTSLSAMQSIRSFRTMIEETIHNELILVRFFGLPDQRFSDESWHSGYTVEQLFSMEPMSRALETPNRVVYGVIGNNTLANRDESGIAAAMAMQSEQDEAPYGVACMLVEYDTLMACASISEGISEILLTSREGKLVFSTAGRKAALQGCPERIGDSGVDMGEIDGEMRSLVWVYVPYWDCYLSAVIDPDVVKEAVFQDQKLYGLLMLILAAMVGLSFWICRQMMQPMHDLIRRMDDAIAGDYSTHLPQTGPYETRETARAFNVMIDSINASFARIREETDARRQAEIRALQAFINPHFFNNTITSFKMIAMAGQTERLLEAIDSFTCMLRETFDEQQMVTVDAVCASLRRYGDIQRLRTGDRIHLEIFAQEEARALTMPKLVVQPFLENAYFHAFDARAAGCIHVFFGVRDGKLVCEIMDDGVGIPKAYAERLMNGEAGESVRDSSGIGIMNVMKRLRLMYGEAGRVYIHSEPGMGTTVTVELPLERSEG